MQFGVVVTTQEFGPYVTGLLAAAVERGWQCRCFLTDTGVRVISYGPFRELVQSGKVRTSVCEFSWERFGGETHPDWVPMGSQYQNAELVHQCDKVLVF